jgi:hypothetical protein
MFAVVQDSYMGRKALGYSPLSGFCEHGNEPLGSIKKGIFPDQL